MLVILKQEGASINPVLSLKTLLALTERAEIGLIVTRVYNIHEEATHKIFNHAREFGYDNDVHCTQYQQYCAVQKDWNA